MIWILFLIIIPTNILSFADGARILGIFPINSKSHFSISERLVKALAAKGHEVTVISPFKSQTVVQNYTEIQLQKNIMTFLDSMTVERTKHHIGIWNSMKITDEVEGPTCVDILHLDYIQQLIRSKKKMIDLMIVEMHYTRCYTLLAYKLNVPIVVVTPTSTNFGVELLTGNPSNPSYVPSVYTPYSTNMNFWQRIFNAMDHAVLYYHASFILNRNIKNIANDLLNMELPPDNELNKHVAIVFCNSNPSFMSRPSNPNFIEIAGLHITEAKKLPKDIQDFIDDSAHGVIYFSFGSTIKATSMNLKKINMIIEVFSKLPQRILWRVNELNITNNIPPNIKLGKWFPQKDILEHKNVIAFISHCGLFSILEAIHTATPVIGIPFMFDQFQDAQILYERGVGIYLDYDTMDKQTFANALKEITTNKKYQENMRKLSSTFRDRPISPLNEAVYWTEYAIRYNGAPHLRTKAADMPFYQYLLLDVIALLIGVVISSLYACKLFLKLLFSIFNKNQMEKKKIS